MTSLATVLGSRGTRLRRLVMLYSGLVLFGSSLALLVVADLGLAPWDVLHQGVARSTGATLGTVVIASSALVLLAWLPLRQRPGLGTLSDVIVVGLVIDATLAMLPRPDDLAVRLVLLLVALSASGLATSMYLAAGLGPGPRDGLMTGLAARGLPLGGVRTGIDVAVLVAGWLLGGTAGIGTVASALTMGPIVHTLLPRLAVDRARRSHRRRPCEAAGPA